MALKIINTNSTTFLIDNAKKILLAGLFLAASWFSANIIFEISSFVSIGHFTRKALVPACFFWCIFFILYLYRQGNMSFSFRITKSDLSCKIMLLVLSAAFLYSLIILRFSFLGAVYLIIGTICITGIISALIYTMQQGNSKGVFILLLIYPFILFIQHWFRWKLSGDPYEIHSINIFMPYEIVWILMFSAVLIYKVINKERFKLFGIQKLFLLFGFFLFVSALASPVPLTSLKYFYRDCILPIIFIFIFVECIKTVNDFEWLIKGTIFSGMIFIIVGIYFFGRTGGFTAQSVELFRSHHATSITGYLNSVSILSIILLPIAVSSYFYEKKKSIKIIFLSFVIICLGIILLSKNRSSQLAFIITFPFLFLYAKIRFRYVFVPIVILGVIIVLLKIPYVWNMLVIRYLKWFKDSNFISNVLRADSISVDLWRSAIKIFLDYPLFGIGAGMWEDIYPVYTSLPGQVVQHSGNKPHSLFLQYFAYSGIGAGVSLISIYLYTILKGIKHIFSLKNKNLNVLIVGIIWSICTLFAHEMFRGYQVFNYYGFTVMSMCLFFGIDHLLSENAGQNSIQQKI